MYSIVKTNALLMLSICLIACSKTPIEINNAYVPVRSDTQMHFAAYLDIKNNNKHNISLESVSSEQFKHVSLHKTQIVSGISKMRMLDHLEIKAGDTQKLVPNGKHIMLMQATESIWPRDNINLQLHFADGTTVTQDIPIRKKSHK